jgi:methionyl-tRNA synthetase
VTRRTLVTCALPYANGPIHLGHMVEHIQADIYVRALRSAGEDVVFLCADDTHGTPIELNAQKQGVSPALFVERWWLDHQRDFADFGVVYDHYSSTNSDENRRYAELIYTRAKEAGFIERRDVEQAFDEKAQRFLPDRFIKGGCPNCGADDQYGDACEKCGATYGPRELRDPRSAITGETPVWKSSPHLFFLLSRQRDFLRETMARPGFMHPGLAAQLQQFFDKGLADWDISRDGPYFGFAIPGEVNKFFYVWLDAPIGYISTAEQGAKKTGLAGDALELWGAGASSRIVHVIGKDIVYFHCLFWPAVLQVARLKIPDTVHIHGHLTVNGEKMSKTRGTFINARPYLELLDPSYLRFYYASLLGSGPEDLDFSLTEFRQRVNAELVNNLGNLANRTLSLLAKPELGRRLSSPTPVLGRKLVEDALAKVPEIRDAYQRFDHRTAIKLILEVGYAANQFLTVHEPWKKLKADAEGARAVLSEAAEIVHLLTALLDPVVPTLAAKLASQLKRPVLTFQQLATQGYPLLERTAPIGDPSPLIGRIEEEAVGRLVQSEPTAAVTAAVVRPEPGAAAKAAAEATPMAIDFEAFAKVALRVGKVLSAERVPKADKLLKLSVDLGEGSPRTIVSGIAEAYSPEQVQGRQVVVVANLKPRALRGIESHGMLLTAGSGGRDLVLVDPGPVAPGTEVQ